MADVAKKAGADMKAYDECIASGRTKLCVQQSVAAADGLGFTGTPTFQLVSRSNGKTYTLVGAQPVDVFSNWIDTLMAGKEPPQAQESEKPELPLWAKPDGLAPDPKRPGFTRRRGSVQGKPQSQARVGWLNSGISSARPVSATP